MSETIVKNNVQFLPSINIKLDYGLRQHIERYLPTPQHAKVFRSTLEGFIKKGKHAHLVIGPYGTGKSLLATLLANIVTKKVHSEDILELAKKFQTVDPSIFDLLIEFNDTEWTYIPVFLSGNEGEFNQAIQKALYQSLNEHGIVIALSSQSKSIEIVVRRWEKEFPSVYMSFVETVETLFGDLQSFWNDIYALNQRTINWFVDYYHQQTAGASLPILEVRLFDFLVPLLKELAQQKIGLFFIYDEFGRYMQSLSQKNIHNEMEALQDLAEISEREPYNLHIMFISHQNVAYYANGFEEEVQKEFRRIEKRFTSSWIESDKATVVRLAHLLTEPYRTPLPKLDYEQLRRDVLKTGIYEHLTSQEQEELIVKGSYPLHPIALYALPIIADQVAQNERTLFTFLQDSYSNGLPIIYDHVKSWVLLEHLFDYFEQSFQDTERHSDIYKQIRLYYSSYKRISNSENSETLKRILKTICMAHISKISQVLKVNEWFLQFALPDLSSCLPQLLAELKQTKSVIFRQTTEQYELFQGSDIDFDKLLFEKRRETNYSRRQRMQILTNYLSRPYYLSRSYNDEKNMIRFATVQLVMASEILNEQLQDLTAFLENDMADALIIYVLAETREEVQKVLYRLAQQTYDDRILFAVSTQHTTGLTDTIYDVINLERLEKDKAFIEQDILIREELEVVKVDKVKVLHRFVREFEDFLDTIQWFWCGKTYSISSEYHLTRLLSRLMKKVYNSTPVIKNEAFNRRKITSVQKRAACTVIDHIFYHSEEERLGLTGWGPDYLIYATVLKNNNLHNGYIFLDIEESDENIKVLAKKVFKYLKDQPTGIWQEIINIFIQRPFGIRKPIIPVLLATILKDKWRFLTLKKRGMLVTELSGELLYEMLAEPDMYEYVYQQVKPEEVEVIKNIKNVFADYVLPVEKNFDSSIIASKIAMRWFQSLPHFTQQTRYVNRTVKNFFRCIRLGVQAPFEFVSELLSYSQEELHIIRKQAENFITQYVEELGGKVLQVLGYRDYNSLYKWAENEQKNSSNRFIDIILISENEKVFVQHMVERMIGVNIVDWSDRTEEMLIEQVAQKYKEITYTSQYQQQNADVIRLNDEQMIYVQHGELEGKAKLIFENMKRTMNITGRNLTMEQKKLIYWKLLQEVLQENDVF
jgi:hypothetical protein